MVILLIIRIVDSAIIIGPVICNFTAFEFFFCDLATQILIDSVDSLVLLYNISHTVTLARDFAGRYISLHVTLHISAETAPSVVILRPCYKIILYTKWIC
jgi:hypothetical protein